MFGQGALVDSSAEEIATFLNTYWIDKPARTLFAELKIEEQIALASVFARTVSIAS